MAGPLGGDTRYSQTYDDSGGGIGQLRFIRYNVGDDRFESRMEYTDDGGETWKRGNHQVFRRKISPPKDKRTQLCSGCSRCNTLSMVP
jgi:hypothetical protein